MQKGIAYFLLIISFLTSPELFAQNSEPGSNNLSKPSVTGQVVDESTGEPVPFAQVALYKPGGSRPVSGGVTEADGSFKIDAQPGVYELTIQFLGFADRSQEVTLNSGNKALGKIRLTPAAEQLDEVVVTAEDMQTSPVETTMEGMTVRPDRTISNLGGNLLDVLRNTPSIDVGQDGGISIRGSGNTNILINGRNSALATDLEQIPASAVESIEIINNPNAKYDAEAAGGVINIKLKKGKDMGTNGKAQVTAGSNMRLGTSLRVNHKTEKYNIYGGYNFRRWPREGYSRTTRLTFDNDERLEQYGDNDRNDREHTFSLGGSIFAGKNKFSYEGAMNIENENDFEENLTEVFDLNTDNLILDYARVNNEIEENYTYDNALIYDRAFDDEDRSFRALMSHSFRTGVENQYIDVYPNTDYTEGENMSGQERALTDESRHNIIGQADYAQNLGPGKFETGLKTIIRLLDNDYRYEIQDESGTFVLQDEISNQFKYSEQVYAAYGIYSLEKGKWNLSAGTRLEQTLIDTELVTTGETNNQNYLSLFPSFQSSYAINNDQSLKFTYSRRIDRPNAWRLNPFPDVSDSLNVRSGNPNLQPEFIQSLEFGYFISLGKVEFTTNTFYRHVDGQIDFLVQVENGISYRRPENLNSSTTYGFEIINNTEVTPWWKMNGSFSLFRTEVDGTNIDGNFTNSGVAWNTKLTTDFSLPADVGLQLTGNYTAPEIEAQGRDLARYYVDASVQRSFLEDRAKVSLSLRDIFNTRQFQGENEGEDFFQEFTYKRQSRIFLISASYSF
ncbi:TonB-dependent receptor domain-containing protein [Roseivirga sp. BDSF3-8]|uniref:TonB-dependent receptor domain-containing protein n=1 Tax=Roseivirga sp. BDSF3-8 TaxID=3241598 RepID=UPI003531D781